MHISLDSALGRQRRLNSVGESVLQIAPNAAAAYSLRSLTGGDPKVVRVRRSSDNGESDFTVSGVSSSALTSFVNEDVELFSNNFETNTSGFTLNTGGSNVAVRNTSDGFSGSGCLQLNLTSSSNSINTVKTDTYMKDTDGVIYTVSFYAKAISGSANLVLKIGTESSSLQQISFSENGGEWVKYSLTFVNNFGAGGGNRNQRILFAASTNNTTEWRIDDFQIVQTTSNGFVETWYDQSGNSKNAAQATAGSQPKIVSAGALVTGGIDFDGTNDVLETSLIPPNAATLIGVASWDTASSTQLILGARDSTDKRSYLGRNSSNVSVLGNSNGTLTGGSISVETNFVLFGVHDVGKRLLSTNGTVVSNTDGGASNNTNQGYIIGALNNAGTANSFLNGKIAEVIVYASDQSDNRTALEANIGEAYSIDLPSGVDPGFDQVDGFVETWYDQSSNIKSAVQATAGNQPKIVNAGALLADGIDFDGTNDELETTASISGSNISGFVVANLDGTAANSLYSIGNTKPNVLFGNPSLSYSLNGGAALSGGTAPTNTDALFTQLFISGGTSKTFIDGGAIASGNAGSNSASSDKLTIGNLESGNRFMDGSIKELIIYTSDQSANRPAIETNIKNQYEIS